MSPEFAYGGIINLSMINHFDNAFDCLKYLAGLGQGDYWQQCVFRGESDYYPFRLPSAARGDEDLLERNILYNRALSIFVYDEFISPKLRKTSYGPIYDNSLLLSIDKLGIAYGEGYAQLSWRIQSVFQHYGLSTQWIDLTSDPKVALFFAAWDASHQKLLLDGTGYVYFTTVSSLALSGSSPLVDLSGTSDLFAAILGVTSERPRAQSALSFRSGWNMAQIAHSSTYFECVSFRRTSELSLLNPAQFFPYEPLADTIRKWDELYTALIKTDPERAIIWEKHPLNRCDKINSNKDVQETKAYIA